MYIDELIEGLLEDAAEEYEVAGPDDETSWHFTDKGIRELIQGTIEQYHEFIAPWVKPRK